MLCMPNLHDAGSRNTHKVAWDLIGLSQVVTRFESTILILKTFRDLCRFEFLLASISIASARIPTSSLSQSFKLKTDHSWPCSCGQQLYPWTWASASFFTNKLCNVPSYSSPNVAPLGFKFNHSHSDQMCKFFKSLNVIISQLWLILELMHVGPQLPPMTAELFYQDFFGPFVFWHWNSKPSDGLQCAAEQALP